jgi:hypothetical protein
MTQDNDEGDGGNKETTFGMTQDNDEGDGGNKETTSGRTWEDDKGDGGKKSGDEKSESSDDENERATEDEDEDLDDDVPYLRFHVNCFNMANLKGKFFEVMAKPSSTVMSVKFFLWGKLGIPPPHQRLLFKGNDLTDFDMLGDAGVENDSVLDMLFRGRGGTKGIKKIAKMERVTKAKENMTQKLLETKQMSEKCKVDLLSLTEQQIVAFMQSFEGCKNTEEQLVVMSSYLKALPPSDRIALRSKLAVGGLEQKTQSIGRIILGSIFQDIQNESDRLAAIKASIDSMFSAVFLSIFCNALNDKVDFRAFHSLLNAVDS